MIWLIRDSDKKKVKTWISNLQNQILLPQLCLVFFWTVGYIVFLLSKIDRYILGQSWEIYINNLFWGWIEGGGGVVKLKGAEHFFNILRPSHLQSCFASPGLELVHIQWSRINNTQFIEWMIFALSLQLILYFQSGRVSCF